MATNLKTMHPTDRDAEARKAVLDALKPYADELGAMRMLAILSYTVGQLIALQDQRAMSPGEAMALVSSNIQKGNADAIADVFRGAEGGRA